MPPVAGPYETRNSEATKARPNQAVANFLISADWSFLKRTRIRIAPNVGSQVMTERIGRLFIICVTSCQLSGDHSLMPIAIGPTARRCASSVPNPAQDVWAKDQPDRRDQPEHHYHRVVLRE